MEAEVVSECGYEALQVVLEYQEYVEAELENVVEVGSWPTEIYVWSTM